MEVKAIHKIFAKMIHEKPAFYSLDKVPVTDQEAVKYVLINDYGYKFDDDVIPKEDPSVGTEETSTKE